MMVCCLILRLKNLLENLKNNKNHMKYFICFALVAFVLPAGSVDDARKAVVSRFSELRNQRSVSVEEREVFYVQLEAYLNFLSEPTEQQIGQIAQMMNILSRENNGADYEARYRAQRDQRQRQRGGSLFPQA